MAQGQWSIFIAMCLDLSKGIGLQRGKYILRMINDYDLTWKFVELSDFSATKGLSAEHQSGKKLFFEIVPA